VTQTKQFDGDLRFPSAFSFDSYLLLSWLLLQIYCSSKAL